MKDWAWVWGLVTVLGVVFAYMAYRKAKSSDDTAAQGLDIAQRAEARETEAHFVDWSGRWTAPGVFTLHNTGEDAARKVKLVLYIDDEPYTEQVDMILGGESEDFELPKAQLLWERGRDDLAAKKWARKQEKDAQRARRKRADESTSLTASIERMAAYANDVTVFHGLDAMHDGDYGSHDVYYRVAWRTALGSPRDSGYRKHGRERLGPDYEN